ncbi:MAG: ankyrin repeat-containing domain protein [Monoraphidium minutum]|nr:MAG: ankyrin repeat-containing domain protein [Monoraphidium minutum]
MTDVEKGEAAAAAPPGASAAGAPVPRQAATSAASKRPGGGGAAAFRSGQRKLHELDTQAKVLGTEGVVTDDIVTHTVAGKDQIRTEELMVMPRGLIHPYNRFYRAWWWLVIAAAVVTGWIETYQIAFLSPTPSPVSAVVVIQFLLLAIFLVDIGLSCFVGFYKQAGLGLIGSEGIAARYISLLGLLKLGRMYRVGRLFRHMEYSLALPLVATILARNAAYLLFTVHWAGCAIFYIARLEELHLSVEEIRGGGWDGRTTFHLYIYSVYLSLVTLVSLGGGDLSPWAIAEVAWAIIYLAFNIFFLAYITGSITLCVFRVQEAWGVWRDKLHALEVYARRNKLPQDLKATMQEHLRLQYTNRGTDDTAMLSSLPTTLRRRVLQHEYGDVLARCPLLRGTSPKFVDALLCAASLETFMPRVDLLADGAIAADFGRSARAVLESLQRMAEALVQQEFRGGMASRLLRSSLAAAGAYTGLAYQNTSAESGAPGGEGGEGGGGGGEGQGLASTLSLRQQQARGARVLGGGGEGAGRVVGTLQRVRALVRHHVAGANEARTGQFLSACARGELDRVKLMLGQGFSPDAADYGGRTGLMLAAANGQMAVVDVLLAVSARPNVSDRSGNSPLLEACRAGQDDIINALSARGAKLGLDPVATALELCKCAMRGDGPLLSRLLRCGADPAAKDTDQDTALHIAAAEGNLPACQVLVDAGAPLDATNRYGLTPLDEAAIAQAAPVVAFLEERAGPEAAALARARFLNYRSERFLRACSSGDADQVRAMLGRDCPPDAADYDARTGLMLAAAKGHRGLTALLLEAGANPNARDNLGGCALQARARARAPRAGGGGAEAVKAGRAEITADLMAAGADLGLGTGELASVLCNLVYAKNGALLAAYLGAGADPNASDYDKRAALHIAAAEGDLEMVKLLVAQGASPGVRDRWGNTPADEAKRVGAKAAAEFLTAAAAAAARG